jgi:iron-sulfur cluster assembly protein
MTVSITEAAAEHVQRHLANRGSGYGIRVGVRTSGCSGMAYVLEFVDDVEAEDQVFEEHGVKVVIDPKSMAYLDGTELDFVKEPQCLCGMWLRGELHRLNFGLHPVIFLAV